MGKVNTASIVWKGEGLAFQGQLGSGYTFDLGSPASDAAGSPMEFLLSAVAACTAMDVVHVLRKKRQEVRGVTVQITGRRADDHPQVYTEVDLLYIIQGEAVSSAAVERAIELSQMTYCSASIMFKRAGVTINTDYRIEAGEQAPL